MKVFDARSGIEMIDRDECVRLLASQQVGRLAVAYEGHPDVFPVNYVLDGECIVFRTAEGSKLRGAERERLAFEVDQLDPVSHSGWSGVGHGAGQQMTGFGSPAGAPPPNAPPLP